MSTPAYSPPSVGPAGLTVPSYAAILADNLQAVLNIFGKNQYIAPDSALYQLISIFSLKTSDCNLALQLAYNQTSPQTAVGAGLDRVVKMNGLARAAYSYSTCPLLLTGDPGTVIDDGFAQDRSGNQWRLPSPVTLIGGSATATAVCTTPGNVVAEPGEINIISTPTSGWKTVTNSVAATAGVPVQSDSQLRAVQAVSVALPSLTRLASTLAALLAVPGVTRVNTGTPTPDGPGSSIENPTGTTDSWGNPAHSISMVVEGGDDDDVALAIYGARGIGCFTNGSTSVPVTDPRTGYQMTISFFRPTYISVLVQLTVKKLAGYSSATTAAIQSGIADYLNSLAIGEGIVVSELYGAALTARSDPDQPTFSITSLKTGAQAAQTTGQLTTGSTSVEVTSAASVQVGQSVVDETNEDALPVGVTVTAINGTTITLSAAATATHAADTLSFFNAPGVVDLTVLYTEAALGLESNVQVTTV